jgi:hypothetical protein
VYCAHVKQALSAPRGTALPLLNLGARRGGRSLHAPRRFPPGKKQDIPSTGCRVDLGGRSEWALKISPTPGIETRTVHPVTSHYTNCTTTADCIIRGRILLFCVRAQHMSRPVTSAVNKVEHGYDDIGICDTSCLASDVLWYQLVPHC